MPLCQPRSLTIEKTPEEAPAPFCSSTPGIQDFLRGELSKRKQSPPAENVSRQTSAAQQESLRSCCPHAAPHAWGHLVPSKSMYPQLCTFRPSCARDHGPTLYRVVQRCLALIQIFKPMKYTSRSFCACTILCALWDQPEAETKFY